ncbi:hypothetical protein, partial [Limosilactobacillus fermentum]|uniref:hypothetical protein n=3 Tax=Limosilactobacillus fermentum TaxID=1613 RepID=UPI0021A6D49C
WCIYANCDSNTHQKGACSQATDFSQWWLTYAHLELDTGQIFRFAQNGSATQSIKQDVFSESASIASNFRFVGCGFLEVESKVVDK